MEALEDDTVIIIPSKRPAPLKTIASLPTRHCITVLSDPSVYEQHREYYNYLNVAVRRGVSGSIPQALEVYRDAHRMGYRYFFRLDDDLQPKFFVSVDETFPTLDDAVRIARECIEVTRTSLAGFANTSRRDWLGEVGVFKRTYGLIHGGAQIGLATDKPEQFLDPELRRYDDVYRSAAHRERDGAVGRVTWIGLDKRESLRDSATDDSPEIQENARRIILGRFPHMVSCNGTRTLDNGRQTIPNWRMKGRATP